MSKFEGVEIYSLFLSERSNMKEKDFIEQIASSCIKYKDYGILPSLTIAQACVESKFGTCALSPYFNFFGMKWTTKCGAEWVEKMTTEYENGKPVRKKQKFRAYHSYDEGIEGYYKFITGYKRYSNLIGCKDARQACVLIQQDGWATSPVYAETLYKYIRTYDLERYDKYGDYIEPKPIEDKPVDDNIYVVQKGDTLWSISKRFLGDGVMWRKIYNYNNLTSTLIKVGQVLKIPRKG